MSKEQVVNLMFESISQDNRDLGLRAGMSEDMIEQQIAQSSEGLRFMLSNIYDKLKSLNIIIEQ